MISGARFVNLSAGTRLDAAVLAHFPSSTRAFVGDAVAAGDVLVNGRRAAKGLRLRGEETIDVNSLMEAADNLVAPVGACPQPLFEDDALLAFDKPAGMPVQPLSCRETGSLMNAVCAAHPECRALGPALAKLGESPLMAGALHRIDADTSGLVLVARTIEAFAALRAQFAAQTVKKTYLALVEGSVPSWGSGSELPVTLGTGPSWTTLENDLAHDPTLPFCRMIDAHHNRLTRAQCAKLRPLHAVTKFIPRGQTLIENETRTLLEVEIYTGVTHQIRAQLALAGMHIVNDRLYGAFAVEGMTGHCLHSLAARFKHPVTGAEIEIRTAPPSWAAIG